MNWLTRLLKLESEPVDLDEYPYDAPADDLKEDPEYARDHDALLQDLAAAGLEISGISVLLRDIEYRDQVPILVEWLGRTEHVVLKESIVRALSIEWAKPDATDALLREFGRFDLPWNYRWTVGNALEVIKDRTIGERLLPLVADPRQGDAAERAMIALGRTKYPPALEVLVSKLEDPDVRLHAVKGLKQMGDPAAIPALERTTDDRAFLRAEIASTIKKLRAKQAAG